MCRSTGDNTYDCIVPADNSICRIGAACYAAGNVNAMNPCNICEPTANPTGWTANVGASCGTCGSVCNAAGSCTGSPTADPYEPLGGNESSPSALMLASISDADVYPYGSFNAVLHPASDHDWYRYHVTDGTFGFLMPRADLLNVDTTVNYDLCLYYECDSSLVANVCLGSSRPSTAGSLIGCCSDMTGSTPEHVRLSPDCASDDDSGTVYVHVYRGGGTSTCSYMLQWGDD